MRGPKHIHSWSSYQPPPRNQSTTKAFLPTSAEHKLPGGACEGDLEHRAENTANMVSVQSRAVAHKPQNMEREQGGMRARWGAGDTAGPEGLTEVMQARRDPETLG